MTAYLRTCAVAESVRERVWSLSNPLENNVNEDDAAVDDGELGDGCDTVVGATSSIIPTLWESCMLMSAYIDCGTHLVFHYVVVYCVEQMYSFLADHTLSEKFDWQAILSC